MISIPPISLSKILKEKKKSECRVKSSNALPNYQMHGITKLG